MGDVQTHAARRPRIELPLHTPPAPDFNAAILPSDSNQTLHWIDGHAQGGRDGPMVHSLPVVDSIGADLARWKRLGRAYGAPPPLLTEGKKCQQWCSCNLARRVTAPTPLFSHEQATPCEAWYQVTAASLLAPQPTFFSLSEPTSFLKSFIVVSPCSACVGGLCCVDCARSSPFAGEFLDRPGSV